MSPSDGRAARDCSPSVDDTDELSGDDERGFTEK
jgi:hypothetical protein